MADFPVRTPSMSHLSIGEVLALLLEEFPDVTISKIRFLESQGLIDPERTPSGYRKFYDDDVELLRCILREQRENYLPLRVIKDRLDSGEIDPTSEIPRPRGIRNMPDDDAVAAHPAAAQTAPTKPAAPTGAEALFERTDAAEPLADADDSIGDVSEPTPIEATVQPSPTPVVEDKAPSVLPAVLLTRSELCTMASIDAAALESLESYGVVTGVRGSEGMYGEEALEIATIAKRFLDVGFDARHLRGWKVAADREAGLFEQIIQPLLRQRNPQSREQARQQLTEMEQIGGQLRTALMRSTMRHHYED
jgi:DNA-binding transcriptional MerR regulator